MPNKPKPDEEPTTAVLSPQTMKRMQAGFEKFFIDMVRDGHDKAFVVVFAEGGTRWNFQRMSSKQPIAVVGGARASLLPVRDFHIYRVVDIKPGENPPPDSVGTDIAQMIHRTMCGQAKLGRDVTLGEIEAAARAHVQVRLEALEDQKADIVHPTGAADRYEGMAPELEQAPLPKSAVQICVGDTVLSDPYPSPRAAKESEEWATANQLPEVVAGGSMVWLRPVHDDYKVEED